MRETYRRHHTARWAKQLHVAIQCHFRSKHVERSPWHLCSVGYTIFIALLHDKFLRPTGVVRRWHTNGSVPPPFHVMARRNGVCQNESVSFIKSTCRIDF